MIEISPATPAIKIEEINKPDVNFDKLLSRLTLGGTSSNGENKLTAENIAKQKISDFDSFLTHSIDAEFLRSDPTETYHMLCRVFEELHNFFDQLSDTNESIKSFVSGVIDAVSKLMSISLAQSWECGSADLSLPFVQSPLSPRFFGQMLLNSPLNSAFCFSPINQTSVNKTPLNYSSTNSASISNAPMSSSPKSGAPKARSPRKPSPLSFSPSELASIGLSPVGHPIVGFSPICFTPMGNPIVGFSPRCSSPTGSQFNRSPKSKKAEDPERENDYFEESVRPRDLDLVPRSPATLRRSMDNSRDPASPFKLDNITLNELPSPIYPCTVSPHPSIPFIPLSPLKLNDQSQQPFFLGSPKKQRKQMRSSLSTEIVNEKPKPREVSTDELSKNEAIGAEAPQPKPFRPKTAPRKPVQHKRGRAKRFRPDIAKLKESHAHLLSEKKQVEKKEGRKEVGCKAGNEKKSLASSSTANLTKYDDPQMSGGTMRVAEKLFCPIDGMPEEYLSNSRSDRQSAQLKRLGFCESFCGIAKHSNFRLTSGMHYFGIIFPNGELHCRFKNQCCKTQVPSSVMDQLNKDNCTNPRIYRILMFNPSKSCKYPLDGLKICPVNDSLSVIIGNDYGRYSCVINYAQYSGRRKPICSDDYIWDVVMRNMWSWVSIQMHDMLELIDFRLIQTGQRWDCNICGDSFGTSLQCMRHAHKHVDTNILTCEFCRQDFSRVDALQRHAAMCRCLWK